VLIAVIIRAIASPIARVTHAPEKLALLGAVVLLIGAGVGVVWLFGDETATQVRALADTLPRALSAVEQRFGDTWLGEWVAQARPEGAAFLAEAGGIALTLGNGIAGALLALIGGVYLAALRRRGARYADGNSRRQKRAVIRVGSSSPDGYSSPPRTPKICSRLVNRLKIDTNNVTVAMM
jgi:predicted PurR-regulated permease PerM